jgi:hypothetical protein
MEQVPAQTSPQTPGIPFGPTAQHPRCVGAHAQRLLPHIIILISSSSLRSSLLFVVFVHLHAQRLPHITLGSWLVFGAQTQLRRRMPQNINFFIIIIS